VEEEHIGDMEGMENMEEMYNEMTSSEVVAPGSESVTPRAETHRELAAIYEVGTCSRRSKRRVVGVFLHRQEYGGQDRVF
jgi:hypothetical protein